MTAVFAKSKLFAGSRATWSVFMILTPGPKLRINYTKCRLAGSRHRKQILVYNLLQETVDKR